MIVIMTVRSFGNAEDATMIVIMTVIRSFGNAEDATMIVVIFIIIIIISLVMQRMLR